MIYICDIGMIENLSGNTVYATQERRQSKAIHFRIDGQYTVRLGNLENFKEGNGWQVFLGAERGRKMGTV